MCKVSEFCTCVLTKEVGRRITHCVFCALHKKITPWISIAAVSWTLTPAAGNERRSSAGVTEMPPQGMTTNSGNTAVTYGTIH